ncbi:hypothetical protein RD110_10855 [Rhodoferax koreense]|uniref:Uncharacterized protein n=1 Tax=Rhodoferax koreensis TaxID=1842727 RepID=A0A1P8JV25_9BURK|nr:hypothetical protein RD110_10855 [Rhodoferax koreense]
MEDIGKGNAANKAIYATYIYGFLTGYNAYNQERQISTDLVEATMIAYGNKYCSAFPLNLFSGVAMGLAVDLGGKPVPWKK